MAECKCGSIPSENCIGWNNLTEEQYLEKKLLVKKSKLLNKLYLVRLLL